MNDNKKSKNFSTLSEQLSELYDHTGEIEAIFKKIEDQINVEYQSLEESINPHKSRDISKELNFYMIRCLKDIIKGFEEGRVGLNH